MTQPINWQLRNLVSISEYQKLRKISRQSVYVAIRDKRITLQYIGKGKHGYIDWDTHKDVQFAIRNTKTTETCD